MPTIIAFDQLVGRFQVTQNVKNQTTVEDFIDSIEKSTIIKILGATLGNEFWDDLDVDGVPQEQRFLDIYEAFDLDDNSCIKSSKGISEILLGITYAQYTRKSDSFNTDIGNQAIQGENSSRADITMKVVNAYNDAVDSIKAIQWYIKENEEDYEGYNGQDFTYWMTF